jgi:topoisomerase-4 subunit A
LEINAEEFIAVKGFKALGNQLTQHKVKNIELKEVLPYDDDDEKLVEEIEVNDQEELKGDEVDDSQIKLNL